MGSIQTKLKAIMKEQNVGTYVLAQKAGVPESSIKNIIYGKSSKPRYELVVALAEQLGCSLKDLLSDDDKRVEITAISTKSEETWNAELYTAAVNAVMMVAGQKGIVLSRQQASKSVDSAYNYALANNESTIDLKFVGYILGNA